MARFKLSTERGQNCQRALYRLVVNGRMLALCGDAKGAADVFDMLDDLVNMLRHDDPRSWDDFATAAAEYEARAVDLASQTRQSLLPN